MSKLITMVSTDETKWVAYGSVRITRINCYNPQVSTIYIQLHESPVVSSGDVPTYKSLLIPAGQNVAIDFEANPLALSELTIALSSVEASYTAITTDAGLDLTAVVDSDYLVTSATSVAGALVGSDVATLAVWAQASGPKRLLRVDFKNNSGAAAYPYISAVDSPSAKNSAQRRLIGTSTSGSVANGATNNWYFGRGYSPRERVDSGGAYVDRQGCTIVASASGDINTTTLIATSSFDIRGIYE